MVPRVICEPECQCQSIDLQWVGVYILMTRMMLFTTLHFKECWDNYRRLFTECNQDQKLEDFEG